MGSSELITMEEFGPKYMDTFHILSDIYNYF